MVAHLCECPNCDAQGAEVQRDADGCEVCECPRVVAEARAEKAEMALAEVRDAALEEAAKEADEELAGSKRTPEERACGARIGERIRALKTNQGKKP